MEFAIAVKAVIINNGDEVLLIKRRKSDVHRPDTWDIPGGRLRDIHENPFEGLKREVMEETSLHIEIKNPLKVHYFTREDGQKIIMLVFLCRPLSEDVILSEEHTDFKWLNVDTCSKKEIDYFYEDINLYKNHFR